ncbi:signal recognition particle-docking protein FtsY [Blochmannia endosymbiont of Colobopsis nipponica]|uniref:signal recognition particle-docking protein FtsY n=1 Tax=Blochmannia endosymbiont of Colobopsis nipponica TaxID=2681987 RepID=UPI00177D1D17|nr:signal recognition particle-docking protein FtsY [Blochmannia endosymbiont of Colobopsis nipponica]QOI10847.1 signal recognition particle-docking protein FtsY [Blochmannia endosymbiont of Colobopsis nipponica]
MQINVYQSLFPCRNLSHLRSASLLDKLKSGLVKTRRKLGNSIISLLNFKKIDQNLLEYIEEQLILADVGIATTQIVMDNVKKKIPSSSKNNTEFFYKQLRQEMLLMLVNLDQPLLFSKNKIPFVILIVGVNGVGKTTTIGKLAHRYKLEGKKVMLAAGDTFRAAAIEQLQAWGSYNKIPVISQHAGADAAAVIFDSIQSAKSKKMDILIVDTAGRLQNKFHLMDELKKIIKTMKKININIPHEIMLVIDASTGQNSINQIKAFNESIGVTGIIMTKLDGTAKGGTIFSIANKFKIPIRYIGIGEAIEDLHIFEALNFIEAIFPIHPQLKFGDSRQREY